MILKRHKARSAKIGISAVALAVLVVGNVRPAFALSRDSTMTEWSAASVADQKSFLESLGSTLTPSFTAREDEILACVNMAAQSSAHADLPVLEIAKACAAPPEAPDDSTKV